MRILILLILIIFLLILICYKNRENFTSFKILFYPDPDIETQETWIKEHVNENIIKKKHIFNFLSLLTNRLTFIFYSSEFGTVMNAHNNKPFEQKVPFITEYLYKKFIEIRDTNKLEYQIFSNEINRTLLEILIEYLQCNYEELNGITRNTCSSFLEPKVKQLYFDKAKFKEYDLANDLNLIHKYFISRDINKLINIFKNKLLKYYLYENKNFKSPDHVPCFIYDAKSCPSGSANSKCEQSNGKCVPVVKDDKNKNNNPVNDCNGISSYGENICNRTTNKELKNCKWSSEKQLCMNPDEIDIPTKCEEYSGPELESNCIENENCDYIKKNKIVNGSPLKHEFCYTKDKKNNMTCINFSGILDSNNPEDKTILDKYNCSTKVISGIQYHYDDNLLSDKTLHNFDCGVFDNSSYMRDKNNNYFFKKDDDNKYLGKNIELQEKLCNNVSETAGPNSLKKCNFIKYNNFNNETLTKCIPKHIFLSSNYIDDKATCEMLGYDYLGNYKEKKCLDISAKCNDIKYKSLCDLRDNKCMWIKGNNYSLNNDDLVERGYCVNQDLSDLDNLIDDYHNEEILRIAKYRNLSDELTKVKTNEEIINKMKTKMKIN